MALTEAQKKANDKYHREHIASIACRVRKDQAELFKAYCESMGKTPNAVIKEYVISCMKQEVTP